MVIDPDKAQRFIDSYTLITLALIVEGDAAGDSLSFIALGRDRLVADPDVLDDIVQRRTKEGLPPDSDVVNAVRTLRFERWIYLRDTRGYSIFLDAELKAAYAVYGLKQRIRDVLGDSGAMIETGLVEYDGKFVCDGIISMAVWLGVNYRRGLTKEFDRLKREGKFFRLAEPPSVSVQVRNAPPRLRIAPESRWP